MAQHEFGDEFFGSEVGCFFDEKTNLGSIFIEDPGQQVVSKLRESVTHFTSCALLPSLSY